MTLFETPERRIEGGDKVTGAARYAADITRPGMLHAAFVASPHAHARVVRVETSEALAIDGVRAVITGADVRGALFGRVLQDWPVLCWDTVRFIGDRVAAVAAETPEIAAEAARSISVEYEELPAILRLEDALLPEAPILHADAAGYRMLYGRRGALPHPNVQGWLRREHGDPAAGFAASARIFEHVFDVPRVHQGYLEPRASLVWMDGDEMHVVTTNKSPFAFRDQLAATTGVGRDHLVIHASYIGGDFGGKGLSVEENALFFLARLTGRPVRSVMRYADDLQATNTRHAARLRMRTGVSADGRILAHESHVVFDGGAYAAGKPVPFLQPADAPQTLAGYHVPSAIIECVTVYTNTVPAGHDRAPGQPQNAFAAESHIDLIARELGIDPLAFRTLNAIHAGEPDVEGDRWTTSRMPEVLATLRRESRWGQAQPPGRGRGLAIGCRFVGTGKTTLKLRLETDGSVVILHGVPDQGAGQETVFQRIAARELDVPIERIRVLRGTTAERAIDPGIGASRVTPVQGSAVLDAARKLKALLASGAPAPIEVEGTADHEARVYGSYGYVVEVEVDAETGAVRVLDVVLAADVGTVINPVALQGQLQGGFVFGLGQTLMEELVVEDGRVITTNLGDYKIPTIADIPPIRIHLITDDPGPGPFGAKSVGELANPAIGPAIANAICDAIGVRVFSLPLTAEKVLIDSA